ncbi:MAG TPA: enoyl-CoA hydratase/isomerase family protein, partial [Frankiaceae bacterium]|nr:enoyl-CoA hydratase/isomerase family protein [Frankiaceae bacterium]
MIVEYATEPIADSGGLAATITLNRPDELNAMSWELIGAFDAAVSKAAADPSVRAVLVTGSGRAFSAGGDLKSYV